MKLDIPSSQLAADLNSISRLIMVVVACFVLSACAGSPARIAHMSQAELDQLTAVELCNAYAINRGDNVRRALIARDAELRELAEQGLPDPVTGTPPRPAFTEREWEAIDQRQVFIGMSEVAMICAWGLPNIYAGGAINQTVTDRETSRQYVFRQMSARANYVYVRDGYVYAIQN